jgi:hypothetical protein
MSYCILGNAHSILGGNFEGKGPFGRLMLRREDNILIKFKATGSGPVGQCRFTDFYETQITL